MKLILRIALVALVLFAACAPMGCEVAPQPWPVVPVPPVPVPPTPTPPEPVDPVEPPAPATTYPRSTFEQVKVGDPASVLEGLPAAPRVVVVEPGWEIHAWPLDDERPAGGHVYWEIHVRGGVVTTSTVW